MARQPKRNLLMPDDLWLKIVDRAKKRSTTASDVIRTACEKYLQALEKAEQAQKAPQNG